MTVGGERRISERQAWAVEPAAAYLSLAPRAVELARDEVDPEQAAADLVELAGGRRPALEAARAELVMRLHRRSNDYDATRALRLVSRALHQIDPDAAEELRIAAGRPRRRRLRRRRTS